MWFGFCIFQYKSYSIWGGEENNATASCSYSGTAQTHSKVGATIFYCLAHGVYKYSDPSQVICCHPPANATCHTLAYVTTVSTLSSNIWFSVTCPMRKLIPRDFVYHLFGDSTLQYIWDRKEKVIEKLSSESLWILRHSYFHSEIRHSFVDSLRFCSTMTNVCIVGGCHIMYQITMQRCKQCLDRYIFTWQVMQIPGSGHH